MRKKQEVKRAIIVDLAAEAGVEMGSFRHGAPHSASDPSGSNSLLLLRAYIVLIVTRSNKQDNIF